MADPITTPAASGGIDQEALAKAIGTALATILPAAIAEANKPLHEALGKLSLPATAAKGELPAKGDPADKPLTAAEVKKLLTEHAQQQQQSAQQSADRRKFIADHLADVPPRFQESLGSDPAKWKDEAAAATQEYRAILKAAGAPEKNISGTPPANGAPAAKTGTVDTAKLSPTQLIQIGLEAEKK